MLDSLIEGQDDLFTETEFDETGWLETTTTDEFDTDATYDGMGPEELSIMQEIDASEHLGADWAGRVW